MFTSRPKFSWLFPLQVERGETGIRASRFLQNPALPLAVPISPASRPPCSPACRAFISRLPPSLLSRLPCLYLPTPTLPALPLAVPLSPDSHPSCSPACRAFISRLPPSSVLLPSPVNETRNTSFSIAQLRNSQESPSDFFLLPLFSSLLLLLTSFKSDIIL